MATTNQATSVMKRSSKVVSKARRIQFNYEAFELAHVLRIRPIEKNLDAKSGHVHLPRILSSGFQEVDDSSLVVLLCNNGSFVLYYNKRLQNPLVKQIDWFKNPIKQVKCFSIDPIHISWVVAICVDCTIYVVPLASTLEFTKDNGRSQCSWSSTDLTLITTLKLSGLPVVSTWWHTLDDRNICIIGSDHGDVIFIDLWLKKEVHNFKVGARVDKLHLLQDINEKYTKLQVTTSDDTVWHILLEWSNGQLDLNLPNSPISSEYDLLTDTNINSVLFHNKDKSKDSKPFKVKLPGQEYRMSVQSFRDKKFITKFHPKVQLLEVCSDEDRDPEFIYQLPSKCIDADLTDHILFCLLPGEASIETSLLVLSKQYSCKTSGKYGSKRTGISDRAEVQYFNVATNESIINCYTKKFHRPLAWKKMFPHNGGYEEETGLTCFVIVTAGGILECRPRQSPEVYFTQLILRQEISAAEAIGITFGVNVPTLFELVADKKLQEKDVQFATKLYSYSKCSPLKRVSNLVKYASTADALLFIKQVLKHPDQIGSKDRKIISNMAISCYVHQILQRQRNSSAVKSLSEDFRLFLRDNFDYDEQLALKSLAESGLISNLFEVSKLLLSSLILRGILLSQKERGLIEDALELLADHCIFSLSGPVQNMLLERGYSDLVCNACDGAFLSAMNPADALKFLLMRPDVNSTLISRILDLLPNLSETCLLQATRLFDPSRSFIKPYLRNAQALQRERSLSAISFTSLDSTEVKVDCSNSPLLEEMIEVFLKSIVVLQMKRGAPCQSPDMRIVYRHISGQTSWGSSSRHHRQSSIRSNDYVVTETEKTTLACGRNHVAYIHESGDLYTWGRSHHGKLGHGDIIEEKGISNPFRVEGLHMLGLVVLSVACGTGHTVALCREGVYAWGHNRYGQLGVGDTRKRSRPVALTDFTSKPVLTVACGHYHTLAIQSDNQVWSWGWGIHGQLGLGSAENQKVPKHIKCLKSTRIIQVAAGHSHTAVLCSKGRVFTFGSGFYGQLGITTTTKQSKPKLMKALASETVYLIACGPFQTAAVTEDQTVYITGRNYRQFHICAKAESAYFGRQMASSVGDITHRSAPEMQQFQVADHIAQLVIGNWHYIILTSAGQVFTWGCNDCGQLGHFNKMDQSSPRLVKGLSRKSVINIAAGGEFSVAVNVDDQVFVWGRADGRQLGLDDVVLKDHKQSSNKKKPITVLSPTLVPGLPIHSDLLSRTSSQGSLKRELLVTDDMDFPDFASIGHGNQPYGVESLLVALYQLDGSYNVERIARWCQAYHHDFASAACYQLQHVWHEALRYRVQGILRIHSIDSKEKANDKKLENDLYSAVESVLSAIEDFLSEDDVLESDSIGVVSCLCYLIELWTSRKFELSQIEELFIRRVETIGWLLAIVFFGCFSKVSDLFQSHCKLILNRIGPSSTTKRLFSSLFYSKLTMAIIESNQQQTRHILRDDSQQTLTSNSNMMEQGTSNSDVFLKEIIGHQAKQLQQRSSITLSDAKAATIAAASSANRAAESQLTSDVNPDAVVFTCGHNFTYYYFMDVILPEFENRMSKLPCPLPETTAALSKIYRQLSIKIAAACPYCVYNGMRQEQLQFMQETNEIIPNNTSTFWEA